ncbi:Spore germination protein B3 [Paenibacillus solanacearum]|uniref:Spore germination protein B3 n=1 Tax=Paenibacillus solanacearum TaxID=2048548 RepID=A0A916NVQ1_9BACL|nr:Ger(x)C family spore germination protein [Paenibacillus solanacearum]CAG7610345.1 Spore germination protein B3 [Paenibacillus solanacearum]
MTRCTIVIGVSLLLMLCTSGCTDFVEPNQLAFVMGTGIDHVEGGNIEVSHQIVIPSQMGGSSKGESSGNSERFIVISAKGKDVFEASQAVQRKLSRRLLTSHRILIAIGEEFFNKNDVSKLFDKLSRDPANNQRDLTLMIKGSAKEFLMHKHPMEQLNSIAASKELQINGMRNFTTRHFIIDSVAEGSRSMVPILQIENHKIRSNETTPVGVFTGYALLSKKLKVKGIVNDVEGARAIWMSGKGTFQGVTIPWKNGSGNVSFRLTHLQRRIHSGQDDDPKHVELTVRARAYLLENTASLDMSGADQMMDVQKYLNEVIQKDLQLTMNKIQHWGADVFGIGEYLHRKYPYWWKSHKDDWDEHFENINVSVKANIQLRSIGTSGAQVK